MFQSIAREVSSGASPFNCNVTSQLPFGGVEILIGSCIFLFIVVTTAVTFIDVAFKQMWPASFLDPAVASRVAQIQKMFPQLGLGRVQGKLAPEIVTTARASTTTGPVTVLEKDISYDSVVASAPYTAGLEVDEDLIAVLANNDAFSTVSAYCSSSVRGYAALSSMLIGGGICLGYLWVHNAAVYPSWGKSWTGYLELLGFLLIFFTGLVMCGPPGSAVYRNANILLFTSVSTNSWVLKLHDYGVGGFVLVGFLAHVIALVSQGKALPDFAPALSGAIAQLVGAIIFGLAPLGAKHNIYNSVMGNKISILGEIVCIFSTFVAYVQWVTYPSAVCLQYSTQFNYIMLAVFFAPFAVFVAKNYSGAPTKFAALPSLILMNNGTPVATTGPAPALVFDQDGANLPVVVPQSEE